MSSAPLRAERVIKTHQLEAVRLPQVIRDDTPEPWTRYEVAVIMGPALDEYEREQAAWNAKVAKDKANRGLRSPSAVPLRGGPCELPFSLSGSPATNTPPSGGE
jgi:hypothetical protein